MKKLLFVFMLGIALSACSGTSTKNSTPVQDSVKLDTTIVVDTIDSLEVASIVTDSLSLVK